MSSLSPMLATLAEASLVDPSLVYEPKYDGIRAIAEVGAGGQPVHLWSRLGNEKTGQFPEIVAGLTTWAKRRREPVVLDGEIVALDEVGNPAGFQQLQGRIHVKDERGVAGATAFILFDVLRIGNRDLREQPLQLRREALEALFNGKQTGLLRLSEQVAGDGRALYERALASGWEGLIAKHAASKYKSGKRSPDWYKLKILQEQEFVIGGWTEPRQARTYFGALLLGVYDQKRLVYVGHTGTGFDEKELARVMARLRRLEIAESPFVQRPKTNERPHWVKPELVAQIKFTEWTADEKLRHPVYLGLRDDKRPGDVVREQGRLHGSVAKRLTQEPSPADRTKKAVAKKKAPATRVSAAKSKNAVPGSTRTKNTDVASGSSRTKNSDVASGFSRTKDSDVASGFSRTKDSDVASGFSRTKDSEVASGSNRTKRGRTEAKSPSSKLSQSDISSIVDQLTDLERARRDGTLQLPGGDTLGVTNLHKVFWPALKLTKGDLFRYYTQIAPAILPVLADRPLVMKRFPNGIHEKPFYQHRATDAPDGVRIEPVQSEDARPQLIGGNLKTLLYTCQLAAISQDPWFSRVQTPGAADQVALDLDPPDNAPFRKVLDLARWIHEELEPLGVQALPKTSGSRGLHIYIPLAPGTPYEAGLVFCQLIATLVAEKHPKAATVERSVRARGDRIYVDYLQNIEGKTLASAYSARASEYAGVSTPLTWNEVAEGITREDFTIRTVPARLAEVGDLWAPLRSARGADLTNLTEK